MSTQPVHSSHLPVAAAIDPSFAAAPSDGAAPAAAVAQRVLSASSNTDYSVHTGINKLYAPAVIFTWVAYTEEQPITNVQETRDEPPSAPERPEKPPRKRKKFDFSKLEQAIDDLRMATLFPHSYSVQAQIRFYPNEPQIKTAPVPPIKTPPS